MSEYIPLEVQEEILKRLPIKPLIQFRSVSKPWKSLIDSPDFVAAYRVRHPQPDRFILRYQLPLYSDHHGEDRYLTLVDNDDHSFVQQKFIPKFPDLFKTLLPHSIRVVGSSHGLYCFKGHYFTDGYRTEMVIIWNPLIRKSVGIQVVDMYQDLPNGNLCIDGLDEVSGFGVCPATLDPTLLEIRCIDFERKMEDMHAISLRKVRVFTLSTGAWSILSTNLPRESVGLRDKSQVVIDRFIYWVAFDMLDVEGGRTQSHYLIVSFDLTAKEFKEINLTGHLLNRLCRIQSISKLRESLVLLAYDRPVGEEVYSLWMMMKEPGENRSFTKLYNINMPDATIKRILGFRKTGELILETEERIVEVEIYDPNSEAIDNLGITGATCSFYMCSYMESLLLLDQLDGYIYSLRTGHK